MRNAAAAHVWRAVAALSSMACTFLTERLAPSASNLRLTLCACSALHTFSHFCPNNLAFLFALYATLILLHVLRTSGACFLASCPCAPSCCTQLHCTHNVVQQLWAIRDTCKSSTPDPPDILHRLIAISLVQYVNKLIVLCVTYLTNPALFGVHWKLCHHCMKQVVQDVARLCSLQRPSHLL
jgi:hypothetical protein